MSLIDKIRKAREQRVQVDRFTFVVRRPTDMEAMRLQGADMERLLEFVTGWEGVQEIDLIPGGNAVDVPFDADVFREWAADRPDIWGPISNAVSEAYKTHAQRREESVKN